jgi:hypothetical protein
MDVPMTLTPELRQAVQNAGEEPVRLEDPETHVAYYLLKAEVFERVRDVIQPKAVADPEIPEGIRKSQEAFFHYLPGLLQDRRMRGQWVAYRGDERVKVGRTQKDVILECNRRGLKEDEYDVFVIEPQSPEPEEVDFPSSWR